jgi:hypothetical protein
MAQTVGCKQVVSIDYSSNCAELKHLQAKSGQASQDHSGRNGRSCIPRIRIDDVRLRALKSNDGACSEDGRADVGHNPMHITSCTPPIDEQADGDEDGAGDHQWDAEFGLSLVVVPKFQLAVDAVIDRGTDLRAQEEAQAQGDVVQTPDADGFPVDVFPDFRKGGEDEVYEAVDVCPRGVSESRIVKCR